VSFSNLTLYKRHPWLISVSGSSSALLSTRLFAPARSSSPYFIAAFSFVIYLQRRWKWGKNVFPYIIRLFYYEYPTHYLSLKSLCTFFIWTFKWLYGNSRENTAWHFLRWFLNAYKWHKPCKQWAHKDSLFLKSKIHLNDV